MRSVVILVSILFAASAVLAQTSTPAAGPPDVEIIKYSWSKERLGWEKDPFAAEGSREMRERVVTERRPRTALEERAAKDIKANNTQPSDPPRYYFNYRLSVNNTGPKMIREIDWDYVFTDAATGEELGRRQFTSVEKINSGKRKDLSIFLSSPPTQRISVYKLGTKERDGLLEQVIVVGIRYGDNTSWEAR